MSPFADSPDDFVNFLKENYPEIYNKNGPDGFISRNIYGQFLKKLRNDFFKLADELGIDFKIANEAVIDIDDGFKIKTEKCSFRS